MLKGSIVALVTPMQPNGDIDKKSFLDLLEWHIQAGTEGIVIGGTTGEAATLSDQEQFELVTLAVKHMAKRIPIIAGTGSPSTKHAIELTQQAAAAGADAALVITPYYNK